MKGDSSWVREKTSHGGLISFSINWQKVICAFCLIWYFVQEREAGLRQNWRPWGRLGAPRWRSSILSTPQDRCNARLSKMSSKSYFKELEEKARLQRELEELRGGPKGSNVRLILFIQDKHWYENHTLTSIWEVCDNYVLILSRREKHW